MKFDELHYDCEPDMTAGEKAACYVAERAFQVILVSIALYLLIYWVATAAT